MTDYLVIANPTSGTKSAPYLATRTLEILKSQGHSAELRVTGARGDAHRWASEAAMAGAERLVGCGGDGTLQEIASALDGCDTALGILPSGRCNDFALALGILKTDSPEKLAAILTAGKLRTIDLGALGDKRFLTVATLGFDSEVSRFVESHNLWLKGTAAYVYGVLRLLPGYRFPRMKLRGDFGERDGRMLLAATGNSPCYGGAMRIAPGARLDDGLFDICAVGEVSRLSVFPFLARVLKGTHTALPEVSMLQSKSLEIETPDGPNFICADGETIGQTPCRLEVRRGALKVLAP